MYDPTDDHIKPNNTDPVSPPLNPDLLKQEDEQANTTFLRSYLLDMS
jgi:hypothetical protein